MAIPTPESTLWRVTFAGRERKPSTATYGWDNLLRQPAGKVCVQVVDAGQILLRRPDGQEETVTPGQAFLFRHGEASQYGFPAGNRLPFATRWIDLLGAGLPEHWDALRADGRWVVPVDLVLEGHINRLMDLADPIRRTARSTMASAIHALVMCLADSGAAAAQAAKAPVDQIIDDMVAAPFTPWSLKQAAEARGISREHLIRSFHARLGEPPATWLARQRMARARELLQTTSLSVADIARHCGLGSAHTLARRLRSTTGRPPRDHRA